MNPPPPMPHENGSTTPSTAAAATAASTALPPERRTSIAACVAIGSTDAAAPFLPTATGSPWGGSAASAPGTMTSSRQSQTAIERRMRTPPPDGRGHHLPATREGESAGEHVERAVDVRLGRVEVE